MSRSTIAIDHLKLLPFFQFDKQWFLLTSGDFAAKRFNSMTVSWGSVGIMWNKPFVQVVVRPVRYTYEFIEGFDSFTVCAFSRQHRKALQMMGSKSGRDMDKVARSGLTPIGSKKVLAPGYAEAELIIECRKMYTDEFHPEHFLDHSIAEHYPQKDYHHIYFGEILHIAGEENFRG